MVMYVAYLLRARSDENPRGDGGGWPEPTRAAGRRRDPTRHRGRRPGRDQVLGARRLDDQVGKAGGERVRVVRGGKRDGELPRPPCAVSGWHRVDERPGRRVNNGRKVDRANLEAARVGGQGAGDGDAGQVVDRRDVG